MEILPYAGIYTVSSTEPVKLKAEVGKLVAWSTSRHQRAVLDYIHDCETVPEVSTLSHKAADRLTEEEPQERRDFIVSSLRLDENKLL